MARVSAQVALTLFVGRKQRLPATQVEEDVAFGLPAIAGFAETQRAPTARHGLLQPVDPNPEIAQCAYRRPQVTNDNVKGAAVR